jgi:hypothetical protein
VREGFQLSVKNQSMMKPHFLNTTECHNILATYYLAKQRIIWKSETHTGDS